METHSAPVECQTRGPMKLKLGSGAGVARFGSGRTDLAMRPSVLVTTMALAGGLSAALFGEGCHQVGRSGRKSNGEQKRRRQLAIEHFLGPAAAAFAFEGGGFLRQTQWPAMFIHFPQLCYITVAIGGVWGCCNIVGG